MYLIVFKLYLVGLETVKRALSDWSIKKRHLSNLKFFACRLVEKKWPEEIYVFVFLPAIINRVINFNTC